MGAGIRQRTDHLELLKHRSRPAVSDYDRERIGMLRSDMNEMNIDTVDLGDELRKGIHLCLDLSPVVLRSPIAHERLQLCQLDALRLIGNRLTVRPSCGVDASAKIEKRFFRKFEAEGADTGIYSCESYTRMKQTDCSGNGQPHCGGT